LQIYPTNGGALTPGFDYDNDQSYQGFEEDPVDREKIEAQRDYFLKHQVQFDNSLSLEDQKEE
jgi:hypothetical protein